MSIKTTKQQPVIWRSWSQKDGYGFWDSEQEANSYCDLDSSAEPLYTSPSQQPLTDEQIELCFYPTEFGSNVIVNWNDDPKRWCKLFVRAIEAAHGIKGEA